MLSIVIPVYNVEKYLEQCLDSVLLQSYQDIEIILVNDGSTDNSLAICEQYQVKNHKIKVVSKPNGGLSSARNYGLQYVQGDYLTFLDSDDYVSDSIYEKMIKEINDKELDIVVADIRYIYENSSKDFTLKGLNLISHANINQQALLSPMFAWNKIYRTTYFKSLKITYPLSLWYEDIPVTCPLVVQTNKIGYIPVVGYFYRQRSTSIMGQVNPKMKDIFEVLTMVITYFKEALLYEKYYAEIEYLCLEQIMLYGQFRFIKTKDYKEWYKISSQFMMEHFDNYKKNKYIKYLSKKNRLFINTYNPWTMVLYKEILKRK